MPEPTESAPAILNPLGDSEAIYRALAENIPQRVFYKDRQSRYLAVNRNYAADLGLAPEDMVGRDDYAFHPGALAEKYRTDDLRVMETGQMEECDESYVRDGQECIIHTVKTPVLDDSGGIIGVCGIFWDVTEQLRAREMLSRSEANLREAQRLSQIGSWELDLVHNRLTWSDEIFRIFEIDPRRFGASYEAFVAAIHPEDRDRVDQAYQDSLRNHTNYQVDHRLLMPDGRVKHVRERGENHYLDERPIRSIGTVQDITERKQNEALLDRHNRVLSGLASIKTMLMRETDEQQASQKVCRLLVEQSRFRMAWIGMVAEDGIRVEPIAEAGFEEGYLAGADIRCDDSPLGAGPTGMAIRLGATMTVDDIETDSRITPWRDSARAHGYRSSAATPIRMNGKVIGAINIYAADAGAIGRHEVVLLEKLADDLGHIKERFAAERALQSLNRELEDRVRERTRELRSAKEAAERESRRNAIIVGAAMDGFFSAGLDGRVNDCNEAYCRMLGYTREEMLGLSVPDIEADESPEELAAHIRGILERGHDRFDTRHRRKDGGLVHVEVNVTLARIGAEQHFFAFVHNITDRKAGEAALILARDEAERANRAKSVFLTRMSHELRTPLNAILGFGQLLESDSLQPLREDQLENVREILHAGRHLLEMINEMLDLSRIEAGRLSVSLEPVEIRPILRECRALIAPLAEARGIRVMEEASSDWGCVLADGIRLKQVLINLLSNAVKYNRDQGRVTVACIRHGDALRIGITDTGMGLTPEQRNKLFSPFERLDADSGAIEGTGIGLALSKRLTELMGGDIGLESSPGAGSTFWVQFPVAAPITVNQDAPGAPAAESAASGPRTILYIEDSPANLRLMERILGKREDIRLISAEHPGIGLELAAAHRPDLILLDVNLPDLDGYQVLSRLGDKPETRPIPVIGISANAMPRDVERARAAGFADYLTKPLDVVRLLGAVDATLSPTAEGRRE